MEVERVVFLHSVFGLQLDLGVLSEQHVPHFPIYVGLDSQCANDGGSFGEFIAPPSAIWGG